MQPKIRFRPKPTAVVVGLSSPVPVSAPDSAEAEAGVPTFIVGKNRPPVHTRFGQPGGNRPGRKPKVDDFGSEGETELKTKLTVQLNGKPRTFSKRQLIIRGLVDDAVKRDKAAIKHLRELGFLKVMPKQPVFDVDDDDDLDGDDDMEMIRALAREAGLIEPDSPPDCDDEGGDR